MNYSNYNSRKLPFLVRYMADLLRFRHLCWNLVGSDLRSRFRRSRLGIIWAVIQPLSFALMIAYVYGSLFGQANYWSFVVYVFSGMLVWEYFGSTCNGALEALVNAQGYLKQSRIPFFIFQLRVPLTGLVILLAGMVGLFPMMAALGMLPKFGEHLLLIPAFFGMLVLFMTPMAILLSIVGTQYRDLRYITMIVLQAVFFISPIMLIRKTLDAPALAILKFANPMIPLLDMFRAPLIDGQMWQMESFITISVWTAVLWVLAFFTAARFGRRIIYAL